MPSTTIEIVFNHFPALSTELVAKVANVAEDTALRAQRDAQTLIQSPPKTGRVYKYGKVLHQASAPGESPATDTGALVANSKVEQGRTAMWWILFMQEYAAPLEFGTPKMLPRPFLRPAIEGVKDRFFKALRALGFSE